MNKNLSVYIDFLRTIAAMGVFLGHARGWMLPGMPVLIGAQASQCVAVFFVLSGFVIAFVTDGKEVHWQTYARARALRMYSVTLLALLVGIACDSIGYGIAPQLYTRLEDFKTSASFVDYFTYFTFTNQVWWNNRWIGSNQAFWSLGYEVPYYFLFGLAVFLKGWPRRIGLALACVAIGPRVVAYAPLWLLGVGTYSYIKQRERTGGAARRRFGGALIAASLILYCAVRFVLLRKVDNIFYANGLMPFARSWVHFHLIGIAIAMNIIGFHAFAGERKFWPEWLTRAIRWIAGGSFTLYLVHFPLMMLSLALFPAIMHQPVLAVLDMVLVLVAAFALAELGERRKKQLQRLFPLNHSHL